MIKTSFQRKEFFEKMGGNDEVEGEYTPFGKAFDVAAIAGGLTGLFYGYDDIPGEWIEKIQRREWIESLGE